MPMPMIVPIHVPMPMPMPMSLFCARAQVNVSSGMMTFSTCAWDGLPFSRNDPALCETFTPCSAYVESAYVGGKV